MTINPWSNDSLMYGKAYDWDNELRMFDRPLYLDSTALREIRRWIE